MSQPPPRPDAHRQLSPTSLGHPLEKIDRWCTVAGFKLRDRSDGHIHTVGEFGLRQARRGPGAADLSPDSQQQAAGPRIVLL